MVLPPYRKPSSTELKATLKAATPKDLGNNMSGFLFLVMKVSFKSSRPLAYYFQNHVGDLCWPFSPGVCLCKLYHLSVNLSSCFCLSVCPFINI